MYFFLVSILRKFDIWPLVNDSNINLRLKNVPPVASTRREQSAVFFPLSCTTINFETHGGSLHPPPLHVRVMKIGVNGRGRMTSEGPELGVTFDIFRCDIFDTHLMTQICVIFAWSEVYRISAEQSLFGTDPRNNLMTSSRLRMSNRFKKKCPRPCDDSGVVRFSMLLLGEPQFAVQDRIWLAWGSPADLRSDFRSRSDF